MNLPSHPGEIDLSGASIDGALGLLRQMWVIRHFEDQVMDLFSKNLVRGSTHLYQGQEAVSVGVCSAMQPGDTMTCTYRGHGAVLAMGSDVDRCFGEILGRQGGLCGGKGGSMHLTDVERGALGSNAIVGAHLPISVGAAFTAMYRGTGAVSVAFFGDGAANIGAFHEALNIASIWRIPVVFVLENNQYGEYSPIATTTPIARLSDRAASYGMPGVFVDGNNVLAVQAAAAEAFRLARSGGGPTLIEASTYRQVGHSRSDPAKYRPAGELEAWLARDPIRMLERAASAMWPDDLERIRAVGVDTETDVNDALARALSWPAPDPLLRLEDVYA